jgi:hypothetical protein
MNVLTCEVCSSQTTDRLCAKCADLLDLYILAEAIARGVLVYEGGDASDSDK